MFTLDDFGSLIISISITQQASLASSQRSPTTTSTSYGYKLHSAFQPYRISRGFPGGS